MTEAEEAVQGDRRAIAAMLMQEADNYTAAAEEAEAARDALNTATCRAVAANFRRMAAWITEGIHLQSR